MAKKTPYLYKRERSPYYWGVVTVNGKRYRKALSENKAMAIQLYNEWRDELKGGAKGSNISWTAFKKKYFEWAAANKNENTKYRDELSIEYLEEFKHIKDISEVTPALIDDFKTWLKLKSDKAQEEQKGRKKQKKTKGVMSANGINRTLQSIKVIMRKAEQWKLATKHDWSGISKFKTPKGRIEFFTPEEVAMLLKQAEKLAKENTNKYSSWETVILLGARAGLRRGEIHNLMWSDIDFKKGILSITPKRDWNPKDFECRDIPLSEDLAEHLQSVPRRGEYVIYDRYGYRYSIDAMTNCFMDKVVDRVGLSGNIHKLRHSFASHLVQNDVSLYKVKELLGHSSITTTEIYAHLAPSDLKGAISKLPTIKPASVAKSVAKK